MKYRSNIGWSDTFKGYFVEIIVAPPGPPDYANFRVFCRNFELPETVAPTQKQAEDLMATAVAKQITDLISRKPPERLRFAELTWHLPIGSQKKPLFVKAPPEPKD